MRKPKCTGLAKKSRKQIFAEIDRALPQSDGKARAFFPLGPARKFKKPLKVWITPASREQFETSRRREVLPYTHHVEADPAILAVVALKAADRAANRASAAVEAAEAAARKAHGFRPLALIHWRNHHIAGSEIERVRDELLREPGADKRQIRREYLDARAQYEAQVEAGPAWDRKAGTVALQRKSKAAGLAVRKATREFCRTLPQTPAGAAAMLVYVRASMRMGDSGWEDAALATIIRGLKAQRAAKQG